jgi:paraquat-inducible protein B
MSKKVNKTAIGGFVLGAIALVVTAVLVLGAGHLFGKQYSYRSYFDGSVRGLKVGAPVTFRGVRVGSVTDVSIVVVDIPKRKLKISVLYTVDPAKFHGTSNEFQKDPKAVVKKAILENGLRAELQTVSFVTGQLLLALDFFPGTPADFVGINQECPEIPSTPSRLAELQKTLEDLPVRQIADRLNATLGGLDRLIGSVDAQKTTRSVEAALGDIQALVHNLDRRIGPLADDISHAARAADSALVETRQTIVDVRGDLRQLLAGAGETLESARSALEQSGRTLSGFSEDSSLVTDLHRTLHELSEASRSLRQLSDYLERHPESLLRGKPGAKED